MSSPASKKHSGDQLDERTRAEDILLGPLGFGESAHIIKVEESASGYHGHGRWDDGEEFTFECCDGLDELSRWALGILKYRS